jgi:diguanylate cyclase (GGDEF)-like protein
MGAGLLQRTFRDSFKALGEANAAERLRLAVTGAREAAFDWTIADDRIVWEGAEALLLPNTDPALLDSGHGLSIWMSAEGREKLHNFLTEAAPAEPSFELEFEVLSPAPEWFEIRAVRVHGSDGRIERVTGVLRATTERKHLLTRLTYLAAYDELTGHLNRTRLREELTKAIGRAAVNERHCAYFVAAIDRLAVINETYGFDIADEVIVATGQRLAQTLRTSDVIGRTAGNKFGIILAECGEQEMSQVAERLRSGVREEVIETSAGTVSATVSIGAVWLPSNAVTSQEAMLRAEEALDRAKSTGRNGFIVYAQSPQRESARRRLIKVADDVMAALNDHRLVFAYQPIVGAQSRLPEHYECLLRLARKDGTIQAAGEFIPAAETLGLVRLVDRRALEMAVAQLYAHPDVKLSINVSGTTAGDPSWLQSFITYVRENRAVAERMTVELTETAAIQAFEENARFVSRLRDMGCRVAIDDFGAGFTSFRNLHMLRVDMVKIDGAYVTNLANSPDNQLFVRTLVNLAKNFQLETVAEWVGSEKDALMLKEFGVDYFQGYCFGEPDLAPVWPGRSN